MGRHIYQISGFEVARHARQGEFAGAGKNLNQRMLRGGVLGLFLAFGEAEQHRSRIAGAQQGAADNAVGRVLGLGRQRQDFFAPGINERSFIHASNLTQRGGSCLDLRQAILLSWISP